MGQGAVREREPPWASDPLTCLPALDDLGVQQEFLLLLLAELRFGAQVVGSDEKDAVVKLQSVININDRKGRGNMNHLPSVI